MARALGQILDERLPKRVLFGHMELDAIARSNGWIMLGKTCSLQGFLTHGGEKLKTGQAEGLP